MPCIRNRRKANANAEQGHYSVLLCHLANISYYVGNRKLTFDGSSESFVNAPEADNHIKRTYRPEWVVPENV